MPRRVLSVAMILTGAALAYAGVRSFLLSRIPIPEPPSRVSMPLALVEGQPCCVLEVPRLRVRQTILEGTRPQHLERAPGHFVRSAAPGAGGNCAFTAHRDTHFRFVRRLRKGDLLRVHYLGRIYDYRIFRLQVIQPTDIQILDRTPRPVLTLLSCYPFTYIGPAPKRFAVQAALVE